jgi:hypothetical protein
MKKEFTGPLAVSQRLRNTALDHPCQHFISVPSSDDSLCNRFTSRLTDTEQATAVSRDKTEIIPHIARASAAGRSRVVDVTAVDLTLVVNPLG